MSAWDVDTVFLDRDGTINVLFPHDYVKRWDEFEFLPGAATAVARLKDAGFRLVLVTNQRGVALGGMTSDDVAEIHRRMAEEIGVELDGVFVCTHDLDSCDCRKPGVGLFLHAQRDMPEIEFARSVIVGDSAFDMEAGRRLGLRLVLVGDADAGDVDARVDTLEAAAEEILRRTGRTAPGRRDVSAGAPSEASGA